MTESTTELTATFGPTEFDIREAALRCSVDSLDLDTTPGTDQILNRAKAFEEYLRGDQPTAKQEEPKIATASLSESTDDHLSKCRDCRSLMQVVGFPVPPWRGGRSAG